MPGTGDPSSAMTDLSSEWFETATGPVEQGDLLFDFPLPAMTFDAEGDKLGIARAKTSVVVVTQSCDIPKSAQTELLLATVFDYNVLRDTADTFRRSAFRTAMREGTGISEFALPPRPDGNGETLIVSFRKLHVIPKSYVLAKVGADVDTLRLKSPYREFFAQAYARFMMRVGLPHRLPEIK